MTVTTYNDYDVAIRGAASERCWTSWYDNHDVRLRLSDAYAALLPYLRGKTPFDPDPQTVDYEVELCLGEVTDRIAKSTSMDALLSSDAWRVATRTLTEGGSTSTQTALTRSGTETRADGGADVVSESGTETAKETRYVNGLNVVSLTADGTAAQHTEAERGYSDRQTETAHGKTETLSFDDRVDDTSQTVTHGRTQTDSTSEVDAGLRLQALITSLDYDLHDYLRGVARHLCSAYLGGIWV